MISVAISIRPPKDLRNSYFLISLMIRQQPVAITVNGKEDIVVICYKDFVNRENYISKLEARLKVYDHLAQTVDDVKLGRIQDVDRTK